VLAYKLYYVVSTLDQIIGQLMVIVMIHFGTNQQG